MISKSFLLVALCLVIMAPTAYSFWRLPCAKPITVQRLDPIVNNGSVSGHIHTIMGASAIHSRVNHEDLTNSNCATCTVLEDNSAYWIPALYYQHANGTLESVPQVGGALVYYLQRYNSDQDRNLTAFPKGFSMLAGSPSKRSFDGSLEARAMSYNCLNYAKATPETPAFPQWNCPQGLRTQVFFPSCWDGVRLDTPNHKDHVAYPNGVNGGKCPATHPVRLVSIFYEIVWDTNKFVNGWIDENGKPYRAQPFIWSMGDNTGYGLHGDFMNGWDVDVLQKAVDECTDDSGIVEYCQHFHFRTNAAANACRPQFQPAIEEQVFGQMQQLPNISPIPVASFNPCGDSPFAGNDNQVAGQPLGTCTASGAHAYTPVNGVQGKNTPATPEQPIPMPNPIQQEGYLGCWADGANGARLLEKQLSGMNYTVDSCRAAVQALNAGYVVFGLQYGGECWASKNATNYVNQGQSTGCTMTCRADPKGWSFCGGSRANQVYTLNL